MTASHQNLNTGEGTDRELQLVVFNIDTEEFGIDIKAVQEIIRTANITEIPGEPPYIKGTINLRGRIIVVISLSAIMGLQSREHDASSRIIVAEIGDTAMGFVVDSVSEVIRLPPRSIEPAPAIITSKIRTEYFRGVGKINDRLLILLNLDTMLSKEELQHVQSISSENREKIAA